MNRFYCISFALSAFALTSAAAPVTLRSTKVTKLVPATEVAAKMQKQSSTVAISKAPTRAADYTAIAGDYTANIGDYYFQDSVGEFEQDATITLNGSKIVISCDYFSADVEAAYDSSNGKISFDYIDFGKQTLNTSTGTVEAYVRFEPFAWDGTAKEIVSGAYDVTFDPAKGTISFPADHGFSWVVYSDAAMTSAIGYMGLFDVVSLVKANENENPNEGWKEYGTAKLQDGWVLPLFGMDQTLEENMWEVLVQQNIENENLYRLVDPYHGECPVANLNTSTKAGYIEFDLADPDHVVVTGNYISGFAYSGAGLSKMYCNNYLQYMATSNKMTPGEVVEIIGDDPKMIYTTYKEGVVLLPSIFVSDADGYNNDAMFGLTGPDAYGWQDKAGASINMETKIWMPTSEGNGVEGIVTDSQAPVRYFNLQGVEVANPAQGELVIKTQGGKAVKMIVR